jgi:hypothetical protein
MHQAGASALAQLLRYDPPDADSRTIPCPCGHAAHYKELRSRNVLTVLGPVTLSHPYYVCADCSKGQYPADAALGVAGLEFSPGVRRMQAVVGSEMPFAPGCAPMKLLAGLDVTAKAIERTAEAIGTQIARRDEQEIGRAKQLVLPVVSKQNMPKMYVLMDGVHVPVVAAETEGRTGRIEGQRARTRECKIGCVFTQTTLDPEGRPIRDPGSLRRRHRNRRRVRLAPLYGGLAQRLGVGHPEGGPGRRGRLDLESGRPALSRRDSNRGSVSRPAAFMEDSRPASPPRCSSQKTLDDSHEGTVGRG